MSNSIVQAISLTKEIYKIAKNKGFVEIVTREANGRFSAFTKCLLDNTSIKAKETVRRKCLQTFLNTATSVVGNPAIVGINVVSSLANNVQTEMVRRAVKENGEMLKALTSQVNLMYSGMKSILGVSWLNSALSIANIGVSAAGFMMMHSQLDKLSDRIDGIARSIKNVEELVIENNYIKPYKELISESKVIAYQVTNGQLINEEKLVSVIKSYYSLISSTLRMSSKISLMLSLQIIYDMLPIYKNLIVLYYERFYYENNGRHPLHDEWMSVFDEVSSESFTNAIADEYYLNGRHNSDVVEILQCHALLNEGLRLKIEDTIAALEMCECKENYRVMSDMIDKNVMESAKDCTEMLQGEYSEDEAQKLIDFALIQTIGMTAAE